MLRITAAPAIFIILCGSAFSFDFETAERNIDIQLKRLCPTCKNTFEAKCTAHTKTPACLWKGTPDATRCKLCQELGRMPCPECKDRADTKNAWLASEANINAALQAFPDSMTQMDQEEARIGVKCNAVCSAHLSVLTNLDKALINGPIGNVESLIEKLNAEFKSDNKWSFTGPKNFRYYCTNTTAEFKTALKAMGHGDEGLAASLRVSAVPSHVFISYESNKDPILLRHRFVHNAAHILLYRVHGTRHYPFWIDEGFAARGEMIEFGSPRVYCLSYIAKTIDVLREKDTVLKKLAATANEKTVEQLFEANMMTMDTPQYFFSWSLITMLIERSPEKFSELLRAMPNGPLEGNAAKVKPADQEKALMKAYNYDIPKLLGVWKLWLEKGGMPR